jgi:hypothetical protein
VPWSESLTSDSKKGPGSQEGRDLTQILEYGKKLEEKGLFPSFGKEAGKDEFLEEKKNERLDHFESIDEIGLMDHAPAPSESEEIIDAPAPAEPSSLEFETTTHLSEPLTVFEPAAPSEPAAQFHQPDFQLPESPTAESPTADIQPLEVQSADFQSTLPESHPLPSSPLPAENTDIQNDIEVSFQAQAQPLPASAQALPTQLPNAAEFAPSPIEVKPPSLNPHEGSGRLFFLRIQGSLRPDEQARLSDIIEKASLGIRSNDLAVQFNSNQVLIPRITEYIAVAIAQAIRTSSAEIELHEYPQEGAAPLAPPLVTLESTQGSAEEHPDLPNFRVFSPQELGGLESIAPPLVATTLLPIDTHSIQLQGPSSTEGYARALERMTLEMRRKAKRLGASCITDFNLTWELVKPGELNVLVAQRQDLLIKAAWKLTATALAQREKHSDKRDSSSSADQKL